MNRKLILLVLLLSGCRFTGNGTPEAYVPETSKVERGDYVLTIREVGVLNSSKSVDVKPEIWGTVKRFLPEGTPVKEGDPIIWLDTEDAQSSLRDALAREASGVSDYEKRTELLELGQFQDGLDVMTAESNFKFAGVELEVASDREERYKRLFMDHLINEDRYNTQKNDELRKEQSLEGSDAALERSRENKTSGERINRADMLLAQRRLGWTQDDVERWRERVEGGTIKSPANGIIFYPKMRVRGSHQKRKVAVGDFVSPWRGAVAEIPDISEMEVKSQVPEAWYSLISLEQDAEITFDALPGVTLPARVTFLDNLAVDRRDSEGAGFVPEEATGKKREKVFRIILQLEKTAADVQPGMTASVAIVTERLKDVVYVPSTAVFEEEGSHVVYVKNGGDYDRFPIRISRRDQENVIVEEGLEGGETVVVGLPPDSNGAVS